MTEHSKMTAQEAKQKAEAIRKVILDTYHREVEPSPFFTDLRAGTLTRPRLQGWIKNWYSFALEVNTGRILGQVYPRRRREEFNAFLDRALLVGTPSEPELGYFHEYLHELRS